MPSDRFIYVAMSFSDNLSERSSKEQLIRQANSDAHKLQADLDDAVRSRDMAFQENR